MAQSQKPKCGHRSFGGIAKDGGYLLKCRACGLITATVRPDLTTAAVHRREDWEDAEALGLARAQKAREVRV